MSLRIQDTIFVPTKTGEYQIQLCYGDITKLEEKMDIVMVSAFPGMNTEKFIMVSAFPGMNMEKMNHGVIIAYSS